MTGIAIEWTFRAGDLIVIGTFLAALIANAIKVGRFMSRMDSMEKRFESVEENQKLIAGVLTTLAVQTTRLDRLEKDINEVRHGEGLVGVEMSRTKKGQ